LARIQVASKAHSAAEQRHSDYVALDCRRDAAVVALQEFEALIREQFVAHHEYGSTCPRPDARSAEFEVLQNRVVALTREVSLASEGCADGMDVAVAAHVVEALEGRLEGLRHAVLVESTLPLTLEISDLTAQIADRYRALIGLAGVVGSLPKSVKLTLPPTPHGVPAFEVGPQDVNEQVALWKAVEVALTLNPNAPVDVPGFEPEASDEAQAGTWGRLRKAWREARG
jgi:hypothetical protein